MSESHDKIIAAKEAQIASLDARIEAKRNSLEKIGSSLEEVLASTKAHSGTLHAASGLLTTAAELSADVESVAKEINTISNKLLTTMRDARAAFIFETNQLKHAASGAKEFKASACDLKEAVEIINSIRPVIKELMNNQDELNVIRNIIHACAPSIHRERSNSQTSESSGTTPDVQVG